jgi:hypothetical protein
MVSFVICISVSVQSRNDSFNEKTEKLLDLE